MDLSFNNTLCLNVGCIGRFSSSRSCSRLSSITCFDFDRDEAFILHVLAQARQVKGEVVVVKFNVVSQVDLDASQHCSVLHYSLQHGLLRLVPTSRSVLINESFHVYFFVELSDSITVDNSLLCREIIVSSDESELGFLLLIRRMAVFECQGLKVNDVLNSNAHF